MKLSLHHLLTTLLLFSLTSIKALAQPQVQGEPQKLIEVANADFMSPVWSPDGNSIAFTSSRYQGLWIANANGTDIRQITDEEAGFGFSWSMDSQAILTRVSAFENKRRKLAIKIFHTDEQQPIQLTEYRNNMPSLPVWANYDRQVVLIENGNIEAFDSQMEVPAQFKQQVAKPFYILKPNEIAKGKVPQNGTENISPFEDAEYLNLEVSPDGKKLAFEVYGGNLYVMNIDGSGLMDLGRANRPSWSPDSKYVVAMMAEDNGENITKSDLYAFNVDNANSTNLTANTDLVAMNPDWSPSGNKIAFNTSNDGSIYILNVID